MSNLQLEDLPDEIILRVLSYLEIKNLIHCGHLSKRIRIISHDESLWRAINLSNKQVPTEFIEIVINRGCKYLSLNGSKISGPPRLKNEYQLRYMNFKKKSQLRYLDLRGCDVEYF